MMNNFEQIIFQFRETSASKRGMGDLFERFIKQYFLTDRLYSDMVENVWLWTEFPYRGAAPDTGIDIVVKTRNTQEYWAVQCKFYDEKYTISKADIDTFLSASGKAFDVDGKKVFFSTRYVVSSTDKWGKHAEEAIEGQFIPVNRIRLQDLKESSIDWDSFSLNHIEQMKTAKKKSPLPHQVEAINDVMSGFENADRGKLIMACGTGKTFTSLKIAERITNGKGNVLFLVPSISLLNQTLIEWTAQSSYDFHVYAICSDPKASKTSETVDTVIPATTNVERLALEYNLNRNDDSLNLFFSTYQSIDVIAALQKKTEFEFSIIVCDEAHRTTGVTLSNEDESNFVKVHNNDFIKAKKRLYMTATPRIYADESKAKAVTSNALLCSMDDESIYGKELHSLGFSKAVEQGLLSDYKVIVLAVDEAYVNHSLQKLLTDASNELNLDDSIKIMGCWNGLSKKTIFPTDEDNFKFDPAPMKRAVAFCNRIVDSKKLVDMFDYIVSYFMMGNADSSMVNIEIDHVDGTFNALAKKQHIDWLKEDIPDGTCRILSNARCLSEGIDVPALDAVMFLNPRNSIVDIIQSVGRVMRKSEDKKFGYIILPIGIPAGVEPEEALADNQKYKIVWDVLQALRAHDDHFNNTINKIELNKRKPDKIQIIGVTGGGDDEGNGKGGEQSVANPSYSQIAFNIDDMDKWKNSIYAKIVKKCGSRKYWENWAKDIADIAQRHITRINGLLGNKEHEKQFDRFLQELRNNLNPTISHDDAIEMLAQHMITKPVFDALFEDYQFIQQNPVSVIMQDMLNTLDESAIGQERETLDKFYSSVQERAKDIDNAIGKQKIIIELYEQFFKTALPKQVEKLGIVYTPVEAVDFILNSVEYLLNTKFSTSISSKGVHVLDPFTGTGTFIVQLLRSGIIKPEHLLYKYTSEIHANEIVLLAYYIAAVNIEETFHDLYGKGEYVPFDGIVLTDTFELSEAKANREGEAVVDLMFHKNSDRAKKQLETDIQVIIGNPPYSAGQKSANDNNQNVRYEKLDTSVAKTYGQGTKATLSRNLYDPYIKAFRWASDRIPENGVIGFISNGSFVNSQSLDGFRRCLLEEFNSVYCFNLRGDQRTSGERSRQEGGKIFGSGSRASIAITFLVKKKGIRKDQYIHYYDIGDYLTRQQKLDTIAALHDISQITWKRLTPDENNDWINFRNPQFDTFMCIGDKKKGAEQSIFSDRYAIGLSTNRDAWVYNFSESTLAQNVQSCISFFNSEVKRCHDMWTQYEKENQLSHNDSEMITFLQSNKSTDATNISWSRGMSNKFNSASQFEYNSLSYRTVMHRPFCKQRLYFDRQLVEMPSKWESIFPEPDSDNLVICVSGAPLKKSFSVLMTNTIQDLNLLEHAQCFPLYWYEEVVSGDGQLSLMDLYTMGNDNKRKFRKRCTISDAALKKWQSTYGKMVMKEDIFYYCYSVMQSKSFVATYADNLSKTLPRIPLLDKFKVYVEIGKALATLHMNYEKCEPCEGLTVDISKENYQVEQIKFAKTKGVVCKDTIIYNQYISISNIPVKAYEYIINGKSAIEWLMERYAVVTDKDSHIINDPNEYAGGKYVFDLLLSIISMSLKTQELIDQLPEYKEI